MSNPDRPDCLVRRKPTWQSTLFRVLSHVGFFVEADDFFQETLEMRFAYLIPVSLVAFSALAPPLLPPEYLKRRRASLCSAVRR